MKRKIGLILLLLVVTNFLPGLVYGRTYIEVDVTEDGYIDEAVYALFNATTTYRCTIVGDAEHWYVEFNISDIHVNATIDRVRFKYTSEDGGNTVIYGFESLIQPSQVADNAANNQKIFDDADNGTAYVAAAIPAGVNVTYVIDLGAQAVIDLQDAVANGRDYFVIGARGGGASVDDIWAIDSGIVANYSMLYINWHLDTDYVYQFTDTYYENGTRYIPPVNVTATGSGFVEEFNTSGGTNQYYPVEPELFYWGITDGVTTTSRRIYSVGDENLTVTYPESSFDTFVFTIRDFTNKLSKGVAYLEAWRIINATDTLIERQKIDVHNEVPINLVYGATYTIRVRFYDGSYYDWGTFVPGETTTFTIVLRGVAFTDQAYQVANFIFVEIARPTGTTFTVDYEATKNQTIWANVTIMIRNGAIVSQISRTNNSFVYNYAGAVANTSYIVLVEGVHTLRRTWGYTRIFDATETYPNVPDMETIFPMGNMDTTSLIGWVLTIASGLTFSLVYRKAALLAMGTVGALVTVFGFTDWSYYLLAFVWFFGIIVYLGSGEKG